MTCWVACRSWRQSLLSPWIAKGLNLRLSLWVGLQISSLMRWILPSVVLRSAMCQGKLPTSWTCTYLLIFFCNSKFTAGFIYFYFLNHFLWTKVCWKQTANQTPFWCGCRMITSDVWHLTDTQRVTYECWRGETCLQIICQFCSCVLGRGALLREMVQTLEGSGMLQWSRFCLCINNARLHWDVTVNFQRQAVHHLPPAFQLTLWIISCWFRYWGKLFRHLVVWQYSVEQCWLTATFQIAARTAGGLYRTLCQGTDRIKVEGLFHRSYQFLNSLQSCPTNSCSHFKAQTISLSLPNSLLH